MRCSFFAPVDSFEAAADAAHDESQRKLMPVPHACRLGAMEDAAAEQGGPLSYNMLLSPLTPAPPVRIMWALDTEPFSIALINMARDAPLSLHCSGARAWVSCT